MACISCRCIFFWFLRSRVAPLRSTTDHAKPTTGTTDVQCSAGGGDGAPRFIPIIIKTARPVAVSLVGRAGRAVPVGVGRPRLLATAWAPPSDRFTWVPDDAGAHGNGKCGCDNEKHPHSQMEGKRQPRLVRSRLAAGDTCFSGSGAVRPVRRPLSAGLVTFCYWPHRRTLVGGRGRPGPTCCWLHADRDAAVVETCNFHTENEEHFPVTIAINNATDGTHQSSTICFTYPRRVA